MGIDPAMNRGIRNEKRKTTANLCNGRSFFVF